MTMGELACSNEPESYANGRIVTSIATQTEQAKAEKPE